MNPLRAHFPPVYNVCTSCRASCLMVGLILKAGRNAGFSLLSMVRTQRGNACSFEAATGILRYAITTSPTGVESEQNHPIWFPRMPAPSAGSLSKSRGLTNCVQTATRACTLSSYARGIHEVNDSMTMLAMTSSESHFLKHEGAGFSETAKSKVRLHNTIRLPQHHPAAELELCDVEDSIGLN